jgi:zinc D-Ala-D-Ala carboxypeptidase
MAYSKPARPTTRRIPRLLVTGLLVVSAATTAALGYPLLASSSARDASAIDVLRSERPWPPLPPPRAVGEAVSPTDVPRGERRGAAPAAAPDLPDAGDLRDRGLALLRRLDRFRQSPGRPPDGAAPGPPGRPGAAAPGPPPRAAAPGRLGAAAPEGAAPRARPQRGATGEADGVAPDGTTVFDDEIPGVARLNPALLSALRRAATAAAKDGVKLYVTSGWRSPEYQSQLLREAVSEYGSEKEAARWVATANTSPHVSGDAVDIGPSDAMAWLSKHGATYGLCQIYGNEPWHYELRPEAFGQGCPPMYADPTRDPRMRQ